MIYRGCMRVRWRCNTQTIYIFMKFFWVLAPCRLFSPVDGGSMFLRNFYIDPRIYATPKPSITSPSPPWKPQISRPYFILFISICIETRNFKFDEEGSPSVLCSVQCMHLPALHVWWRSCRNGRAALCSGDILCPGQVYAKIRSFTLYDLRFSRRWLWRWLSSGL
jgi:hypothetical protein